MTELEIVPEWMSPNGEEDSQRITAPLPGTGDRDSEAAGDTYIVSVSLESLVTLSASNPFYRKFICLSSGDEIIDVALVFLDRTSDIYSAAPAIIEEI